MLLASFPRLDEQVSSADARRAILVRGLAIHEVLRGSAEEVPFRRQMLILGLQSLPLEQLQLATPYFWAHVRAAYAALASRRDAELGPRLDRLSLAALDSFAILPAFRWQGALPASAPGGFHVPRLDLSADGDRELGSLYWSPGRLHFVFVDGSESVRTVSTSAIRESTGAQRPVCGHLHAAEVDLGDNAAKLELDSAAREAFAAQLAIAWQFLEAAAPDAAAIVRSEVEQVIPLRMADKHLSFSLSHLPRTIFVGAARSPWPVVEALVHEAAHLRLNHAAEAAPLTIGGRDTVCYSPWRDDPRPIEGVVHGVYAFSLVLGFWLDALRRESSCLDAAGRSFAQARCAALQVQLEDAFNVLRQCRLAALAELVVNRLSALVPETAVSLIAGTEYEHARLSSSHHRQRMQAAFPDLIVPAAR